MQPLPSLKAQWWNMPVSVHSICHLLKHSGGIHLCQCTAAAISRTQQLHKLDSAQQLPSHKALWWNMPVSAQQLPSLEAQWWHTPVFVQQLPSFEAHWWHTPVSMHGSCHLLKHSGDIHLCQCTAAAISRISGDIHLCQCTAAAWSSSIQWWHTPVSLHSSCHLLKHSNAIHLC